MKSDSLDSKRERLLDLLQSYDSCAVAFSGGVDSAVVAKAAHLALGDRAVAVTAVSPSLAEGELEQAQEIARLIDIRHETLRTAEFSNPDYVRNASDRCYHCKTELYTQLDGLAEQFNVAQIANGANIDDADDYRPGMTAATEHRVKSPLAECGFNKDDVRALARHWSLPVWNKPAMPCLSSRVAYGEEVTPERLRRIDRVERWLRGRGLSIVRVRCHKGEMARIEVPVETLPRFCDEAFRQGLVEEAKAAGFQFITLDLEGFRSGSLNSLVPLSPTRI